MPITKRSHEGYLLIDNRNSPGVSAEFIKASGMDAPVVGAGEIFESAVILCSHCQSSVVLNPNRTRERAWCWKCDHYICDGCAALKECRPFNRVLAEAYEQAIRKGNSDG